MRPAHSGGNGDTTTTTSTAVVPEYLSAGANRQTAVADWGADGTVAFGADLNVALWRPRDSTNRGITALLSGHSEVVKAVKFLPRAARDHEGFSYIVTGSDDKAVKIWSLKSSEGEDGLATTAECIQTTQSHTAPVNCIATLSNNTSSSLSNDQRIFATGAADATIKVWTFDGTESRVVQTIKPTPKFFPLAIAMSRLDDTAANSPLILAAAGTRDTIQLFVAESAQNPDFKHQATLSGHEGWIRSLDFVRDPQEAGNGNLLLASASQDKYIRLWRFHAGTELPTVRAEGNDPSLGAYLPGRSPSNKVHRLKAGTEGKEYSVTFEALLLGHDDWIYSAKWFVRRPATTNDSTEKEAARLQLLSTSADNTLTIWEADPTSGIWLSAVRLGEISREKGATTATGSTGGFWTGLWSADGNSVTCLGRTGSWRLWNYNEKDDQWLPQVGISGHTRGVTGVAWAKNGDYLLSTSLDQTTRLHASWKRPGQENEEQETWHEMSRPQIHGYDLNCIDTLGATSFVSGADEKLMRVFSEPKAVANLLEGLSGIAAPGNDASALPDAANMPVLGLSNKAIEAVDDDVELDPASTDPHNTDRDALDPATTVRKSLLAPTSVSHPPFEDMLSRHTLWPEAEKLYGHGYEISCLAASHDGKLIASACKASSLNHAVIRLFETERWTEIRPPLAAHTLTATRLRWSSDDRYLLSVGRDRAWAVFEREQNEDNAAPTTSEESGTRKGGGAGGATSFKLKQTNPKGHTRMILDAAWAPPPTTSGSGLEAAKPRRLVFATAGRDKQVKLWHQPSPSSPDPAPQEASPAPSSDVANTGDDKTAAPSPSSSQGIVLASSIPSTHPVTAIDFLPHASSSNHFILAVGTEAGNITVHRIDSASLSVAASIEVPAGLCLAKAVLQLSWRPGSPSGAETGQETTSKREELAVAGDDGSLRVYSFRL
ncbi:WD40-repeat-containing domain protein [Microdochium trichocladiopsis]|uniref:Elongator complex protein 2 n=1 Tax=Microdochium trichocladiopsis TaxID=1682393 RepID=A0A9P9BRN9_9PEZI|nr:WD40-repeat-containing domain protein [Microdochium trichocladiopsis]KAH7033131.1 WD40-repeat-containing domain protein [Microdochium trichocladiopsis]